MMLIVKFHEFFSFTLEIVTIHHYYMYINLIKYKDNNMKYKTLSLPEDTHTSIKELAEFKGMKLYKLVEEMLREYKKLEMLRR